MRPRDVTEGIPACGVSCAAASLHICADGVARRGRRLRSSDNRAVLRAPRTPQPRRISNGDRFVAEREKECLQINTRRHAEGPIMDDAQVPAAHPVSSGCLRGRILVNLALDVPPHVVYCRNNERVISVVLVFLSLCLSVLGFRFLLFAKQEPSFSPSLCHSLLLGFGFVVAVRASRASRQAGRRAVCRRCNEGVHDGLDSGARAILSCNRSRAYRFPDDLEALRGDWRRFTARHDSGGARVRGIAPRPRLVASMRDLRGLAQMSCTSLVSY